VGSCQGQPSPRGSLPLPTRGVAGQLGTQYSASGLPALAVTKSERFAKHHDGVLSSTGIALKGCSRPIHQR
jgi:hypothetical protein